MHSASRLAHISPIHLDSPSLRKDRRSALRIAAIRQRWNNSISGRSTAREPVLFRLHGGRAARWEALARCTIFANASQRRRRPFHFVAALEPATVLVSRMKCGDTQWIAANAAVGTPED